MFDDPTQDHPSDDGGGLDDAASALNLRLLLAVLGIALCAPLAAVALLTGGALGLVVGLVLLGGAGVAVADLVVVQHRRHERAAAERDRFGQELSHSFFE